MTHLIRSPVLLADLPVLDSLWDPAGEKKVKEIMTQLYYRTPVRTQSKEFSHIPQCEEQGEIERVILFHISGILLPKVPVDSDKTNSP